MLTASQTFFTYRVGMSLLVLNTNNSNSQKERR